MTAYVYILASRPHGAIHVGATIDLRRRVEQHRAEAVDAHTRRYRIRRLVWFEVHEALADALLRERRIKRWARSWKDDRIAAANPCWRDIGEEIPW